MQNRSYFVFPRHTCFFFFFFSFFSILFSSSSFPYDRAGDRTLAVERAMYRGQGGVGERERGTEGEGETNDPLVFSVALVWIAARVG